MDKRLQKQIDSISHVKHEIVHIDIDIESILVKDLIAKLLELEKLYPGGCLNLNIDSGYENHYLSPSVTWSRHKTEKEIEQERKNIIDIWNDAKEREKKRKLSKVENEEKLYKRLKAKYEKKDQ